MVSGIQSTGGSTTTGGSRVSDISPEEFLQLLITQLKNQDPFEPVKNQDVLEQVSAVRELQSSMDLSQTLGSLAVQQQIAAGGSLLGKLVKGLDANLDAVEGVVTGVRIEDKKVYLELDTGNRLALGDVTEVSDATAD